MERHIILEDWLHSLIEIRTLIMAYSGDSLLLLRLIKRRRKSEIKARINGYIKNKRRGSTSII